MGADPATRPTTHQKDLARLPRALAPLCERPQWAVWRWTLMTNNRWQKPPFMATHPQRHASTRDPSTWCDYGTALATVQAGNADGLSYILTEDDPFAAIDLDHCRHVGTHSIDTWAQNFLDTGRHSYSEVTPSGSGCRIWGLANGNAVHKKFLLEIDGKPIAVELFRRTSKALTVTGYRLDTVRELANIDRVIDWGLVWGERRKAAAAQTAAPVEGHNFNGSGSKYSIDEIEQIVRDGPPTGTNRSDVFHSIVGHYLGCDWSAEQIFEHLQQFPDGIGRRYLREGRLHKEIARSAGKYAGGTLPLLGGSGGWINEWDAKAPQPEILGEEQPPPEAVLTQVQQESAPDDALNHDDDLDAQPLQNAPSPPSCAHAPQSGISDQEQREQLPEHLEHEQELEEGDPDEDDLDEEPLRDPKLPPLYTHGDANPRPPENWLVKHLFPVCGHGLLSGQWGTGKTFVMFDLAAAVMTGQPFLGHAIKRQCGVLLIAAEGADQVRLRLEAVIRAKCGDMRQAPFCWYETAPMLLHKGSTETLIAMARQANDVLQQEFGLPLGLTAIDTIAACAGYARAGDENDPAAGQAVMNVLKTLAQAVNCFVLGIEHFGKNLDAGTRGASSKEASSDLVLACLGPKGLSGNVVNTRLAVRKNRGGRQGQEYPFALRIVEAPEPDEDGEPVTTMVVDWQAVPAGETPAEADPWKQCRRQDQQTAVLRLKRILMGILAEKGVELPIAPDGPEVRMVDLEIVREQFYVQTPTDGTPEQKGRFRRQRYRSALDWAEQKRLIGVAEIDGLTYLYLLNPQAEAEEALD